MESTTQSSKELVSPFSVLDLIYGAIMIRLERTIKKLKKEPDIVFLSDNLAIGGYTKYSLLVGKVDCILDLRQEAPSLENFSKELGFDYLKLGIKDGGAPTLEQVKLAIRWIKGKLRNGKKVLIHCNLGRGRAPLIACIFLCSEGFPLKNCLNLIRAKRKYVYFNSKQLKILKELGSLGETIA
ncbi:MAG: dual specificity protein phosphatase family protein [Thermoproteota archaeon]|nr:dual specificity protein phosphatase family protein [Candidatus Brockarchaeota archaeon]